MKDAEADALTAAREFALGGIPLDARPYGSGHIHDTFIVTCRGDARRYVLQRINGAVLKDPLLHIENARIVSEHLSRKFEDPRRYLSFVYGRDGKPFWTDAQGRYWRGFLHIDGTRVRDTVEAQEDGYQAAKAFGAFIAALSDLPVERVAETIAHFHDTAKRFLALECAAAQDGLNRAASAQEEIEFAFARKDLTGVLTAFEDMGELKRRVVHNDTKINNVLFDQKTGEGLCVVDLDTVMPGLALYDIGDFIRTALSSSQEDERDLEKIAVRMPVFQALARGFLEELGEEVGAVERDQMVFSGKLITYELGMRFLTDYLTGDGYFKISRPGQNLDRARAQFALVRDIERKEEEMMKIVSRLG